MSSTIMAQRKHGVCQGCLYRSIGEYSSSSSSYYISSSSSGSSSSKVYEYCVLVGVHFSCYESHAAFEKGQPPVAQFCIVGSSMAIGRNSSRTAIGDASFKLVTNQGTHLKCTAPTTTCRDIWLRALAAGLQESLTAPPERQRPVLKRVKPRYQDSKSQKYCASCGKVERWEFPLVASCRPLSQYGWEDRRDLCHKCETSQGMLDHCHYIEDLYAAAVQERKTLLEVRRIIVQKLQGEDYVLSDTEPTNLSLQPLSHHLLQSSLRSPQLVADCRTSPILEDLGLQFQQGLIGVLEFVEMLEHAVGIKDKQMGLLKTQAFRVAGDMGTALKLLNDCQNTNDIELFHSILEFFLDLLDEGELKTLAFFWPQLCMIHLQLLPPTNAASLMQVELLEDFMLTVATQHSVHLAIALIWSHTADLEDSRTLPYCLNRKYAVLRFLCELESLLFDFDSGWGGGSVTVGAFVSPSNHQVACLKTAMEHIQDYRLSQQHEYLSRSRRLTKLRKARAAGGGGGSGDAENQQQQQKEQANQDEENPEEMAQEALRIATNADYLSSHLVFTKRLCDIAEKLRFLDVEKRPAVLRQELAKLNTSGAMGGDPMNSVKDSHTRVIRIPMGEGHVFRSKERTPVLLLAEVIDEGVEKVEGGPTNAFPKRMRSDDSDDENDDSKLPTVVEDEKKETKDEGETAEQPPESAVEDEDEKKETTDDDEPSSTKAPPEGEPETAENPVETNGNKEDEATDATANTAPTENGHHEKAASSEEEAKDDGEAPNGEPTTESPPVGTSEDAEDFHSAQGSVGEVSEEPLKTGTDVLLSGSLEGLDEDDVNRSSRHALRRFDSPKGAPTVVTPSTNKDVVESLVTEVVAKQLCMPTLMSTPPPEEEEEEESAEANIDEDKNGGKEAPIAEPAVKSKVSALSGKSSGTDTSNPLSKTGDTRREVLTAIMQTGMEGSHTIAAGAATAAQRHLQDLERRRAVELLLTGEDPNAPPPPKGTPRSDRHELLTLGIRSASTDDLENGGLPELSEDDEAMEAIRLLLIQYQVAQGGLSLNDAAAVLAPRQSLKDINKRKSAEGTMMHFGKEFPEIEAGDVDQRLVGCGVLPPAVLQALTLRKANMITNGELLELVKKDLEFVKNSSEMELSVNKLNEDSAFWGRFAFGERWAEKRSRIAASSPEATQPGWDLIGMIVKSNDDLRQEAFVMQLIELCKEAFQEAGLELWLLPYKILSTGRTTGIIEMVRNAMSFDALKKRPGYGKGGLRDHLRRMTQFAADPGEAYKKAQQNFVRSLAAYSLLSYLFLFKDRHNGNLLLDTAGHVIHIDFGFVFGTAPGGSFSLEMSTPFKLTEEMIEVMDGLRSSHFSEFVTLFCCGFLALQAHSQTFLTLIEITCKGSTFDCFEGKDSADVLEQMKSRLRPELDKAGSIAFCLDIIKEATQSYGTAQYDYFQYLSQGIAT